MFKFNDDSLQKKKIKMSIMKNMKLMTKSRVNRKLPIKKSLYKEKKPRKLCRDGNMKNEERKKIKFQKKYGVDEWLFMTAQKNRAKALRTPRISARGSRSFRDKKCKDATPKVGVIRENFPYTAFKWSQKVYTREIKSFDTRGFYALNTKKIVSKIKESEAIKFVSSLNMVDWTCAFYTGHDASMAHFDARGMGLLIYDIDDINLKEADNYYNFINLGIKNAGEGEEEWTYSQRKILIEYIGDAFKKKRVLRLTF